MKFEESRRKGLNVSLSGSGIDDGEENERKRRKSSINPLNCSMTSQFNDDAFACDVEAEEEEEQKEKKKLSSNRLEFNAQGVQRPKVVKYVDEDDDEDVDMFDGMNVNHSNEPKATEMKVLNSRHKEVGTDADPLAGTGALMISVFSNVLTARDAPNGGPSGEDEREKEDEEVEETVKEQTMSVNAKRASISSKWEEIQSALEQETVEKKEKEKVQEKEKERVYHRNGRK